MNIPALEIIELDQLGEPRNGPVQQELQKRTGDITVPQVFYNDEFIGNNEAIQNLHKKGELAPKFGL
jgi:glutaredoxin